MTHTYQVTGMTCGNCEAKVKSSLQQIPGVSAVEVSKENNSATISMNKHIDLHEFQEALGGQESKYQIMGLSHSHYEQPSVVEPGQSWLVIYRPILLIFAYILGISILSSNHWMQAMHYFMAAFFLVFSFFKLLNIRDFADSYAMYDIVAKRFSAWGFIYPFVELALGIAFLIRFQPFWTNVVTLLVMGVSAIGVIQSVLDKRKIRCACLGAVFNLPMSTVTIIEDLLMVAMSAIMLLMH